MSLFQGKRFADHDAPNDAFLLDHELLQTSGIELDNASHTENNCEQRSPRYVRTTKSFQPKRVSELPPLESESDSEDENDNLNCAILNDSFLLTPSKGIEDIENSNKKIMSPETGNFSERTARICLEEKLMAEVNQPQVKTQQPTKRVPLADRSLFDMQMFNRSDVALNKPRDSGIHSTFSSIMSAGEAVTEIEFKPEAEISEESMKETKALSPPKLNNDILDKSKNLFVTPREKIAVSQVRAQSSRIATSTTSRKSRSTLENEFKSQKILFATPLATGLRRPAVSANDSLSLSLIDTPIKSKERPLSPIIEQPGSKKHSTDAVTVQEKKASPGPPSRVTTTQETAVTDRIQSDEGLVTKPKPLPIIAINEKEYQILRKLGSGGSSSVFLAKQTETGVECALKLVNLQGDANLVEGYLNETRLLAKLQGNENVVALYGYCHVPEAHQLFLVMEKGDSDLQKILQDFRTDIPLYTLMQIWYQMLQCVHYIHEHGVIHLDLKPANFLMVKGRLKLIDFGIASNIAFDSTSIMKFSQAGTFNYISPEALIDTSTENSPANSQPKIKMSKKSDIWSLGCILYLLLYKKTPFAHIKNINTKVHIITNPNTEIEFAPLPAYYPPMLLEMLQKCLKYDPKARASTAELLQYPFEMVIPIAK